MTSMKLKSNYLNWLVHCGHKLLFIGEKTYFWFFTSTWGTRRKGFYSSL